MLSCDVNQEEVWHQYSAVYSKNYPNTLKAH